MNGEETSLQERRNAEDVCLHSFVGQRRGLAKMRRSDGRELNLRDGKKLNLEE